MAMSQAPSASATASALCAEAAAESASEPAPNAPDAIDARLRCDELLLPGGLQANRTACADCDPGSGAGDVSKPISIVVASDRDGFAGALLPHLARERDFDVVVRASVGDSQVLLTRAPPPPVVLLDKALLDRPDGSLRTLIGSKPRNVRVIVLSDAPWAGAVEDVLRYRFHGFLLTGCTPGVCVKAIRAVSRGEHWLPRGLLAKALSELLDARDRGYTKDRAAGTDDDRLTKRETQIVALVRQGSTNKEIARQLGIMEDTVKKHLQSVFGKLGVRRRTLVALRQLVGQSSGQ
jgi:DNA-binding NarL/FixJ family response regulator